MQRVILAAGMVATAMAKIEQIHISYTGKAGELAVDFVGSTKGNAAVYYSIDKATWKSSPATQFNAPTIGYMSQALMDFTGIAPGAPAYYYLTGGADNSTTFTVTPIVARPEIFAVLADFGFANDVSMDSMIAEAQKGSYDSVLHAGDWVRIFHGQF